MANGIWSMDIRHPTISHRTMSHQPLAISHDAALAFFDLIQRARAAADRGADERALLAAEDRAEPGAGRGRAADHHRRLGPVTSGRARRDANGRAARRADRAVRGHRTL